MSKPTPLGTGVPAAVPGRSSLGAHHVANTFAPDMHLKPCPFCGREARLTDRADAHTATGHIWFVACFCGGYSANAHQHADTLEGVLAKWNTRPIEPLAPGEPNYKALYESAMASNRRMKAELYELAPERFAFPAAGAGVSAAAVWHAPGLGEVHSADHKYIIFCEEYGPDEDASLASNELAEQVCIALNASQRSKCGCPPPAPLVGAWVSVHTRLPADGAQVICWENFAPVGRSYKGADTYYYRAGIGFVANPTDNDRYGLITHWMDLPPEPSAPVVHAVPGCKR